MPSLTAGSVQRDRDHVRRTDMTVLGVSQGERHGHYESSLSAPILGPAHFESPTTSRSDLIAVLLGDVSRESLTWRRSLVPLIKTLVSHGFLASSFRLADVAPFADYVSSPASRIAVDSQDFLPAVAPVRLLGGDVALMGAATRYVNAGVELRVSLEEDGDVD